MTTRHEFLAQLHELLRPKVYLEIGVQHGWSLQLSEAELSIGVDPNPLVTGLQLRMPNEVFIARQTSNDFFTTYIKPDAGFGPIDFAFIDGMHLAEFAMRDFTNVERYSTDHTVVVIDDVMPTTQDMAMRTPCPGDWTGDVWKVYEMLRTERSDLVLQLVDTEPTGVLVVTGLNSKYDGVPRDYEFLAHTSELLPEWVLDRRHAWSAAAVIDNLRDRGFAA